MSYTGRGKISNDGAAQPSGSHYQDIRSCYPFLPLNSYFVKKDMAAITLRFISVPSKPECSVGILFLCYAHLQTSSFSMQNYQ